MHTLLRAFVTATSLIEQATETQIDQKGAKKALATVWADLPRLDRAVIAAAEELLDDSTLANGSARDDESRWLKAVIDEVGTPAPEGPVCNESESWKSMARSTAWLAFCLRQAGSYAQDADYAEQGFAQVCQLLTQSDEYERAVIFASVNEAALHIESMGSPLAMQIKSTYDELLAPA